MIDKITEKIKRYPFQTGIIIGVIACLLLVGFISLFQDNGRTLSENNALIREDYLRMTINEYGSGRDEQLAAWRYRFLGSKADETLQLMRGDDSISAQLLAAFANTIGKADVLRNTIGPDGTVGTPASPRKGLSGFGKTVLIILGLLVLCAAGFYAASMIQTKKKQKLRAEANQRLRDEPVNIVTPEQARAAVSDDTPDTLFDLDKLFPPSDGKKEEKISSAAVLKEIPDIDNDEPGEDFTEIDESGESNSKDVFSVENDIDSTAETEPNDSDDSDTVLIKNEQDAESTEEKDPDPYESSAAENSEEEFQDANENNTEAFPTDDDEEDDVLTEMKVSPLDIVTTVHDISTETAEEAAGGISSDSDAEKPLVETDSETETENEDELLKMIRAAKTTSDEVVEKYAEPEPELKSESEPETEIETGVTEEEQFVSAAPEDSDNNEEPAGDLLIHYQSTYRIGNDMYDEVFSIDQGDTFRGECGISIGETLNNTEPKAVTAFEIWLFDKDDIHTATWYLLSDFALENDGIKERLQQHGNCERIRKNGVYVLETETLQVEIRVLDLEYGTEMEEKNSYFTNVAFDVVARGKEDTPAEQE